MKRIAVLAVLTLLCLSSCGSTWWSIGPVKMTAPTNDNAALSCASTPILLAVPLTAPRTMHLRVTQGAWVFEDSIATVAGTEVSFPTMSVPLGAACTLRGWASDVGGAGCDTTTTKTPRATTWPPARPAVVAS